MTLFAMSLKIEGTKNNQIFSFPSKSAVRFFREIKPKDLVKKKKETYIIIIKRGKLCLEKT